ncbi:MAG: ABC transporter ATP-binding protein [Dehalococcoidales bacterium]
MALIETVGLGQRRGDQEILKNVNISVDAGEVFALIGPTGSGKTTLLRLIDLIDAPSAGRVYFDGEDVTDLSPRRLSARRRFAARRRMAFVLQKPIVFNASVFDNVACGLKWRGVSGGDLHSRVAEVLDRVGLADYRHRRARTLSGGEMQMVAIARAMAIEPEVLLLDEPTANLDPVSTARIEGLIAGIIDRHRTTILMTTHDMSQGQRLADRAAILLDGEIHQTGEWHEIFSSPRSRRIADFVGVENVIDGVVTASRERVVTIAAGDRVIQALADFPVGEPVFACVRAEDVTLSLHEVSSSARNTFAGEIVRVAAAGPVAHVEIDCGFRLTALVTRLSAEEMALDPGVSVHGAFKATAVHVIRRESAATDENSEAER